MLASRKGQPSRGLSRSMGKPLPHALWFDPPQQNKKGWSMMTSLFYLLVELRGIEPLTPRLPVG